MVSIKIIYHKGKYVLLYLTPKKTNLHENIQASSLPNYRSPTKALSCASLSYLEAQIFIPQSA